MWQGLAFKGFDIGSILCQNMNLNINGRNIPYFEKIE
jgi:hypothetical protein